MTRNKASYKYRPIASVDALGKALGYSAIDLRSIAARANSLYRLKVISKPGKKDRHVFPAREPLRTLQNKINTIIFRNVEFPSYLMGGIPDPSHERGFIKSAQQHAGSALLISEDVSNFYPSVTEAQVRCVFQHVLRFPAEISHLLAKLCTRQGRLVQGASPSTYIANLVFYQYEPELFAYLKERGMNYRRFVDDICVSSQHRLNSHEVTAIVNLLRQLIEREGLKTNRKKQLIAGRGRSRTVHNLNVDGCKATIPSPERKRIRANVFEVERLIKSRSDRAVLEAAYQKACGRVTHLSKLHPHEAGRLKARLNHARAQLSSMRAR